MFGCFVISLDFELLWGMKDLPQQESYKSNVEGGRKAIPEILNLFEKYNIHATWATVGIMLNDSKSEILQNIPSCMPAYKNVACSAYSHIDSIGESEKQDPFHYANSLLKSISQCKGQEIGTHTYSHYYCLEAGAESASFDEDIRLAVSILKQKDGICVNSIVFPRNQYEKYNLDIIEKYGIQCYRGNPKKGYDESKTGVSRFFQRAFRFLDSYLPIYGPITYQIKYDKTPINVCASRFLRPYSNFGLLERLKIKRIKGQMLYAAKHGEMFHLWWHPHNMGMNTDEMLKELENILLYYKKLNATYGFRSCSMSEYSNYIKVKGQ